MRLLVVTIQRNLKISKLLEFNRDFSDSAEDIQNEKEHVVELFEKLQNSNEFNILAHYLDTMFMDEVLISKWIFVLKKEE